MWIYVFERWPSAFLIISPIAMHCGPLENKNTLRVSGTTNTDVKDITNFYVCGDQNSAHMLSL